MASAKTLVLVPGHGVCTNPVEPNRDDSWHGIFPNEARLLVEHICAGVRLAVQDPSAVLVFSGGMTRPSAGELSEALSYRQIAEHGGWFGHAEVAGRTLLEE